MDNLKVKIILLVLACCTLLNSAFAQPEKIQAAIVNYFIKNVEWPKDQEKETFNIYVIGNSNIYEFLNELLDGTNIDNRQIKVARVASIDEIDNAQIIYLSSSKLEEFDKVSQFSQKMSCLFITNKPGLGAKGSAFNFIINNGKQAFEINENYLSSCNLRVSSKLKDLGILVQ